MARRVLSEGPEAGRRAWLTPASKLTSIEINATHYRLQSPKSFRKWAATAPDGFIFSVKGPRLVTQQKVLAETGDFITRFLESGLIELGDKLGPVVWQFAPFKRFDEDDFGKFLELLPRELEGRKLNHVVEVRHGASTPALRRAAARLRRRHCLCRRRELAEHRRSHRRHCLCAAAKRRRCACRRLSAGRTRCLGWARPNLGARPAPDDLPLLDAATEVAKANRATCSSTSSMRASCARRPRPWR